MADYIIKSGYMRRCDSSSGSALRLPGEIKSSSGSVLRLPGEIKRVVASPLFTPGIDIHQRNKIMKYHDHHENLRSKSKTIIYSPF